MSHGIRSSDNYGGGGTLIDFRKKARQQLRAEREIVRFSKRKTAGHWRKLHVDSHVADGSADIQRWFVLIDYRNGNRRLLKRALTRLEVWRRNKFLAGSGKAWAMVND